MMSAIVEDLALVLSAAVTAPAGITIHRINEFRAKSSDLSLQALRSSAWILRVQLIRCRKMRLNYNRTGKIGDNVGADITDLF